jgi:hypothetical protein
MRKYARTLAVSAASIALLFEATPARADVVFACQVTPATYLSVDSNGIVYTWVQNVGQTGICSLSTTWDSVSSQACTAWYSSLLAYRLANKTALLYFTSGRPSNAGTTACTSFSAWQVHAPYYLEAS